MAAVPVPFDATGIVQLTDALLVEGFGDDEVAAIMGGNALRLLAATAACPGLSGGPADADERAARTTATSASIEGPISAATVPATAGRPRSPPVTDPQARRPDRRSR